jgi:hypothetical protein
MLIGLLFFFGQMPITVVATTDSISLKPPTNLRAMDTPNDHGESITLFWDRPLDISNIEGFQIFREAADESLHLTGYAPVNKTEYLDQLGLRNNVEYQYSMRSINPEGVVSIFSELPPVVTAYPQWFKKNEVNILIMIIIYLGLVVYFVRIARKGKKIFLRRIPGLDALEEAVGRATEMGKPILYVPGIWPMDEIGTIAAMNILKPVSKKVAQYESRIIVPCIDPIVMNVAQQTVKEGFTEAGRPDRYNQDDVFFLTSAQFAYAAGVNGIMVREKPATNLFLGVFFAESLLLAETGNATGAIQIAGTDRVPQLPFFVAACDYCIMGEELYAASAYLSEDPRLISSIKAQDWGKMAILISLFFGSVFSIFGLRFILSWFSAG